MLQINTLTLLRNWKDIKNIPKSILLLYVIVVAGTYLNQRSAEANALVLESHTIRLDSLSDNFNKLLLLANNIRLENNSQNEKIEELQKKVDDHEKRIEKLEDEKDDEGDENEDDEDENEDQK